MAAKAASSFAKRVDLADDVIGASRPQKSKLGSKPRPQSIRLLSSKHLERDEDADVGEAREGVVGHLLLPKGVDQQVLARSEICSPLQLEARVGNADLDLAQPPKSGPREKSERAHQQQRHPNRTHRLLPELERGISGNCRLALREGLGVRGRRSQTPGVAGQSSLRERPSTMMLGVGRVGSILTAGARRLRAVPSANGAPRGRWKSRATAPAVSPYAYEWFIEGEMLAAEGRHDEAAVAFESATAAPSTDPLLMTRSRGGVRAQRRRPPSRSGPDRSPADTTLARRESRSRRVASSGHRDAHDDALDRRSCARSAWHPDWDAPVIAMAEALEAKGNPARASAILLGTTSRTWDPASVQPRSTALLTLARRPSKRRGNARRERLRFDSAIDEQRGRASGRLRSSRSKRASRHSPYGSSKRRATTRTPRYGSFSAHREVATRRRAATFLSSRRGKARRRCSNSGPTMLIVLALSRPRAGPVVVGTSEPRVRNTLRGRALRCRRTLRRRRRACWPTSRAGAPATRALYWRSRTARSPQRRPGAAAESVSVRAARLTRRTNEARRSLSARKRAPLGTASLRSETSRRSERRSRRSSSVAADFEEAAAYYASVHVSAPNEGSQGSRACHCRTACVPRSTGEAAVDVSGALGSDGAGATSTREFGSWSSCKPTREGRSRRNARPPNVGSRQRPAPERSTGGSSLTQEATADAPGEPRSVLPEQILDPHVERGRDLVE